MCGFVGEVSLSRPVERPSLYRMANALVHRGPDESSITFSKDRRWGLAHRRLCVVDIEGGKQPMQDPGRGLSLVFNGEIYEHDALRDHLTRLGYPFRTRSDTEVLLALYAYYHLDCFRYLRGEFAFALIDEHRGELILARDRVGLKPLFYTRVGNRLLFSSEIKAIFRDEEVPRRFDPTGLLGAIAVADTPGYTAFEGIRQVEHAQCIRIDLDTLQQSSLRYWDAWQDRQTHLPHSESEQVDAVRESVEHAINIRLRADVPVGAYLSGGLDSSLVTCVMADKVSSLDAFSLSFVDSPRHDEYAYAEAVAREHENIRLHRIPVSHRDTIRYLPDTVWHMEKPFGNLHSVAKLMASRYARQYVVAVLTGDGGDEAFCGYSTYWLQNVLQECDYSLPKIQNHLKRMRREASQIGGNRYYLTGGLARKIGPAAKFLTERLGFPPCDLATAFDAQNSLRKFLHPDFQSELAISPIERAVEHLQCSLPDASHIPHATLLQYVQLNMTVPEYIAPIADRTEWAGSVEARPPLFDHKVLELAMGLPLDAKLKGDREKHILREAFRDAMPASIEKRRKQAFLAPPSPFNSAEGNALIERYLSQEAIREAGIWDERKIRWVRVARRLFPRNNLVNLLLTIVTTSQMLHEQFIRRCR